MTIFIQMQQAAKGERKMKKNEAMKATGMAMSMRTKNQMTDHAQPRAIAVYWSRMGLYVV